MDHINIHIKQSRRFDQREIPVKLLFLAKYGRFPEKMIVKPNAVDEQEMSTVFHVQSVRDRLNREYHLEKNLVLNQRCFHRCSKTFFVFTQLCTLEKCPAMIIYFHQCQWVTNYSSEILIEPDYPPNRHFLVNAEIQIYYLPEHAEFVGKLGNDLVSDRTLILQKPKITQLELIAKRKVKCNGTECFYLTGQIQIRKPLIPNLAASYGGEEFLKTHEKIVTWLNKKDTSGLVLLHGSPGSGKTYYLRYLLNSINQLTENKRLIYVPADMISSLTNPLLLPLLLRSQNSLLIIEDAEGGLSRTHSTSQSVANLLNLTDGLLTDGVRVQIVVTFNCSLESLDAALLRPGRLVAEYRFPEVLSRDNARNLAHSIGIEKSDGITQPMSLADVYGLKEQEDNDDDLMSSTCPKCSPLDLYLGDEEE